MTNFFLGNWATRVYFLTVVAAATFMVAANAAVGPSFAGIFLIALTSPVSVIFAPIFLLGQGGMTVPMMIASVTAGYLLNTLLINTIVGEVGSSGTTARDQGLHVDRVPRMGVHPMSS